MAARRPVWTVWNIRAEAERLLRTEVPVLDPARHRELADAVTALAISPRYSISVQPPALPDEPSAIPPRPTRTPPPGTPTGPP